jgi:hypothetical protein
MDSVTFARQSFLEACENLVVACESNNDVETQAIVDKIIVACGVFSNVQGCPTHDEESIEEKYVLVQAFKECN